MDSSAILEKAKKYRDYTAKNLSEIIKVPGFSCTEKERIKLLKKMCKEAGMEDIHTDGLGSLLGRVGKGGKVLVFDAHIDTVGVGDPSQWKTPPHSGLVENGLVRGRGASDQLGGAASMITAARILKEAAYSGGYYDLVRLHRHRGGLRRAVLEAPHRGGGLQARLRGFHRADELPPLPRPPRAHGDTDRHQGSFLSRLGSRARRERRLQGGPGRPRPGVAQRAN